MFWLRPSSCSPDPVAGRPSELRSAEPRSSPQEGCSLRCIWAALHRAGSTCWSGAAPMASGARALPGAPAAPSRVPPAAGTAAPASPAGHPAKAHTCAAAPWQSRGTKGKEENEEWAPHAASAFLDWTRGMDEKAVGSSTLCLAFYSFALTFS